MPISVEELETLIRWAPGPRAVSGRDYAVVAVNEPFLRAAGRDREEVLGRVVFEVFPGDPEVLRTSLERVLATGRPDRMPVGLGGPTRAGGDAHDGGRRRALNFPVHDDRGRVTHVIHELEDGTPADRPRGREVVPAAGPLGARGADEAVRDRGHLAGRLDLDGTLIDADRGSLERCGLAREEVVGKPFWECGWWGRSPEVRAWVRAAVERARGGESFRGVSAFRPDDGPERVLDLACIPIADDDGRVRFLLATGIDVTERARAERERHATAILEGITDAFFSLDRRWRFTYLNPQAERQLLRRRGELLGKVVWEEFPAAIGTRFEREYRAAMDGRRPATFEEYYPAPLDRWYEVNAYPTDDGLAVYFRNVTERRRAEEALAEARRRAEQQARHFDATLSAVRDFVFAFDPELRVRYANRALLELWQVDETAAIGRTMEELGYPAETSEQVARNVRRVLETGRPVSAEVPYRNPSGAFGYYDYTLAPVFDDAGAVVQVVGSARETTGRREAEDAVRRSEARFRALVTATSDVVYRMSPDWSEMRHLDGRAFIADTTEPSRTWLETYVPPDDRPAVLDAIAEAVRTGGAFELEHRVTRADGSIGRTFSRAVPIRDDRGEIVEWFGTARDVTGRREAEAESERIKEDSERRRRIYEAALSNTPDLVYVFDLDHRFLYANEALLRMWGRRREDALGKNCLELGYEPWHAAMHDREIEQVVATRRPIRGEVPFTGTGGRRIYDYIFVPVLGEDGDVVAVAGTTRDITERQQAAEALRASEERLRRSEERFRAFMDNSPAAAWMTDTDGRIVYVSGTYRRTFRLPDGEVVGKDPSEIYPEELARVYVENIRAAAAAGAPVEAVERGLRADGSDGTFLVYKFPLGDSDGRTLVGGVALDVTERRRAERERERLLEELRQADRRKDEFLAMLAHELRNPLSAIANATQLARRSAEAGHREWARDVVEKHVASLSRMIDDLLDVSRITRGKIELRTRPLDVLPVLAHAVETVRPLVEERRHDLDFAPAPAPLWVEADPHRLEQVVVNLLTNAAKYTDAGGTILLSARPDGDSVVIAVADDGAGIPPERIPEMFELFAQGDRSIARSEGGLGIGLTLVKSLVELHGGSVAARSEGPGRGSEFTVRLPAVAAPAPAPDAGAPGPAPAPRPGRARILVVDDNEDSGRGLARLLRVLGHHVELAHDGPAAVQAARRLRPECVLLDIGLPGMDGYQVAERLRADGLDDAVIIAVSGYGGEAARRRSREAGFDHHLVKPVDANQLVALIRGRG